MCYVSPCLTETSFHQTISWVVLKFRWQKFEQNRKAKALKPADSCCTRSPPVRSGSALTCSFFSKKLTCRDLGDLPTRLGLEKMASVAARLKEHQSQLHPSQAHARWGPSILLHIKSLAIYANIIFPINKPNPIAQCLVLVLTCRLCLDAKVSIFRAVKSIMWKWGIRPPDVTTWLNVSTVGGFGDAVTIPCHVTSAGSQPLRRWRIEGKMLQPQCRNSLIPK